MSHAHIQVKKCGQVSYNVKKIWIKYTIITLSTIRGPLQRFITVFWMKQKYDANPCIAQKEPFWVDIPE